MKIPSLDEARNLLAEAERRNPGPWVQHSVFVAQGAAAIAEAIATAVAAAAAAHPALDPDAAYILGLMHDIGRQEGVTDMRHTLDGYRFLCGLGFDDAAQICLTHSYPVQDLRATTGQWDCSPEELRFVENYLASVVYTDYDRLIQLCDSLALPGGFCLMEKRLVDVSMRRGVNDYTTRKWQAFFQIQQQFEAVIGRSIYTLLPGVVQNTFGLDPQAA